jgi:RNA polymerase sigma-70 factor (family 1)
MKNAPDKDWFQQFMAGDEPAFRYYFDLHNRSVYYIAYNIVQDMTSAEDLVADTFKILWEKRDQIQSENHIVGFLKKVVKHLSINYNNRLKVRKDAAEEFRYLNEDIDEADVSRQMIEAELMRRLKKAVEELPPQCREVFKLLAFEGLTTREAAERLGISERNVLNQKTIAKDRLKGIFSG